MIHPEQWRKTADPFGIPFKTFQLRRVLGYPHAGNDVFHVEGLWQNTPCRAFLKIARQPGSDIPREARFLTTLPLEHLPTVLEWSAGEPAWILTREMPGERLSTHLGDNRDKASLQYLSQYGRALAAIHQLKMEAPPVMQRKFFRLPPQDTAAQWDLTKEWAWCAAGSTETESRCFVHGDFHYANLLWEKHALTAVLDWELAGQGSREFDLAWAMFRRPGQRFLTTIEEIEVFLQGYGLPFSRSVFWRYYVQIGLWFFPMGEDADRLVWRELLAAAMENA